MTRITRRTALASAAALPFAGAFAPRVARAAQHEAMMTENAKKRGFMLGEFEVSTLLAGTRTVENPHEIFGLNVEDARFEEVSEANFIPTDRAQFFFTPTLVSTGSELVLFDTGVAAQGTLAALEAAGYGPGDVDIVVLTHMHGDHIGGLTGEDGSETFSNARYVTGQAEYDYWASTDNEGFATKVKPLAEKFTFLNDGDDVVGGITGMAAYGHTPGHMVYRLDSGDRQLLVFADTANHYVWSVAYPDWQVSFDSDKEQAAATRRTILGMLASERMPFIGYHMPFPAIGFVEPREDGFRYVPESYQMMLEG